MKNGNKTTKSKGKNNNNCLNGLFLATISYTRLQCNSQNSHLQGYFLQTHLKNELNFTWNTRPNTILTHSLMRPPTVDWKYECSHAKIRDRTNTIDLNCVCRSVSGKLVFLTSLTGKCLTNKHMIDTGELGVTLHGWEDRRGSHEGKIEMTHLL